MTTRQAILPCDHPDHLSDHPNNPAWPFKPAYCPGGDLHFATAGTTSKGHTGATVIELTAMRIPTSLPEYENRDQLLAVEWADAWVAFRKGL